MKKWMFIVTALVIFQKWDAISAFVNPQPGFSDLHNEAVVLYATDWCGYCKLTREFLEENDISYHEYDIEKSSEGHEQYKALGGKGVPVVLINNEVIFGYNPKAIIAKL